MQGFKRRVNVNIAYAQNRTNTIPVSASEVPAKNSLRGNNVIYDNCSNPLADLHYLFSCQVYPI